MYLDFFSDVYYINLDSRTDRKKLFEERALIHGIEAKRFSAVQPKMEDCQYISANIGDPRRSFKVGCTLSHQHIVKEAIANKLQNVLIFEDDCVFREDFRDRAKEYINELRNIEWDLFYFGGELNAPCKKVSDNLYRIDDGGVYCTHAYAVNNTFFEKMTKFNANMVEVIDIFLLNYASDKRKYLLGKEIIAFQDEGHSDLKDEYNNVASTWMRNSWKKYVI